MRTHSMSTHSKGSNLTTSPNQPCNDDDASQQNPRRSFCSDPATRYRVSPMSLFRQLLSIRTFRRHRRNFDWKSEGADSWMRGLATRDLGTRDLGTPRFGGGLTLRASQARFQYRCINRKRCGGNALWRKHRLSELTCSLTERAESTLLEGQCGADRLRERDRIFRTK
jgi:hypothetical protein